MELTRRWPQLVELASQATEVGGLQLWAFGSLLQVSNPNDLDVAVIYTDRRRLVQLRKRAPWELTVPPIDLIGLTPDEEVELRFLERVQGLRFC